MSQVKHSDPAAAEKPDRRRGAAGRAAALRRAPSDSDCSGETASLSADSGERRPPPPPPRGKTRNRRRGSEWEVLEGLKDGQRFERRPEVFNGFLHKKRKWPLKGWHKRFFVVDGGILVYARSPTDVARGRLHGSLDVGLSVISAKPRRRRIDIDADEFIYHLRAKTPDVFRTWLNVLKAHRLYRQHLLTFGARESVPKIHAPTDDLPPTDASSRTSQSSLESFSSLTQTLSDPKNCIRPPSSEITSSLHTNKSRNDLSRSKTNESSLVPFGPSDFLSSKTFEIEEPKKVCGSLCSTHCIEKIWENNKHDSYKTLPVIPLSIDEQQMHSTDLDLNTLNSFSLASETSESKKYKPSSNKAFSKDGSLKNATSKPADQKLQVSNTVYNVITRNSVNMNENSPIWLDNKDQTAVFCFSRKRRRRNEEQWTMKRSRKSTNLVKYKNVSEEPCLGKPLLRQMLLCKYKHSIGACCLEDKGVNCELAKSDDKKTDKSTQDVITASEYDKICEKLIFSLFDTDYCNINSDTEGGKKYVKLIVKELYELKLTESEKHPIKFLFKSLLQHFLKNTKGKFKGIIKRDIAINKPSYTFFTRDKEISNVSHILNERTSRCNHDSQDLEKLIHNTIYGCSIVKGKSRETDIKITKTLIDNLDSLSTKLSNTIATQDIKENATDSSELPLLQAYFKHILSETLLPKAVAKDFLNAYLDVLDHRSRSATSTDNSEISGESNINRDPHPTCDVQTESVQKKISKSVSTRNNSLLVGDTMDNTTDQCNLELKDIFDKMIGLFTSNKVIEDNQEPNATDINVIDNADAVKSETKSKNLLSTSLMSGILEDNRIVIDLSKYDVDNISMSSSTSLIGTNYLTINLKEKTPSSNVPKLKNLSLKFISDSPKTAAISDKMKTDSNNPNPDNQVSPESNNIFMGKNAKVPNDEVNLQTHSITSGGTSKANLHIDSGHSFDIPDNNDRSTKVSYPNRKENTQCYFLSSIEEDLPILRKDKIKKLKDNHNFIPGRFSPQTWRQRGETFDEDFIIRVLKHLIVLSKDIPVINKEINNLYLKLKKSYEISAKNFRLGKMYKKENRRFFFDETFRRDSTVSTYIRRNIQKEALEVAINTSFVFPNLQKGKDKALSAIIFAEALANIAVQTHLSTDNVEHEANINNAAVYTYNEVKEKQLMEVKDEWFRRLTQEYVKNNAIKYMLKNYHQLPQSIRIAHPIRAKIPERFSVPKNSSLMKELSNLSPPLTVSNRSQKKKDKQKNCENFEQLYKRKSKPARSESVTDSSIFDVKNDMSDDLKTLYRCTSEPSYCSGLFSPNAGPIRGPQAGFVSGTPGGRLAGWIVESGGPLESASRELGQAQLSVQQLQRLLDAMLELQNIHHHDTDVSLEGASPNVKKDRRKFGLRKKKSNSKCASVELAPPYVDPSNSHMALSALTAPPSPGGGASSMPNSAASLPIACAAARPQSLPGAEALSVTGGGPASLTSLTPDHQLREDFTILAKDLVANLKTVVSTLVVERGRLRAAMESAETPAAGGVVAALRSNLTSALQQNSELRSRLSRIHDASDLAEISSVGNNSDQQAARPFPQSLSYSSSCVSASEFFDAEEHEDELKPAEIIATDEAGVIELDGDSSSEAGSLSSEEGSASSDNSDGATSAVIPAERTPLQNGSEPLPAICTRRSRLPCPRPTPASPSLWNLLYKNIGKDLSQISMPVTINEPLNMLQRLCEELEYSELLDSASSCNNELERMSLIAAFAVSAYAASAHRAASKPFNPLLAETYEYVRGDRDFRFIAEQVSHHPPISACHAESPRWTFWQEARIKTKFWGKSMEFQPTGRVHVRLTPSGDHYSWNKVTTCVHNLFGGQRWVDQYGDMHIVCHGTDITCKLQFLKASSWSSSRHEVRGVIMIGGSPRMRLQGRWSEGLQGGERTLWRPGAMPPDYELYYGFTRFAMELNELEPGMRDVLPATDTRLRPDQRALEEGDVDAAEQFKHELEQAQRERRRDGIEHSPLWFRKTIEDGEETWVFTGEYWKAREAGFTDTPRLW